MSTVISLQEFTALYTEYSRRFTDIAFSYLQDRQEAEDVVSESFMAFWTGRENAPLAQHLPSYILGIVKHKCMDTLRSRESTDRRCRNIYQQACRDSPPLVSLFRMTAFRTLNNTIILIPLNLISSASSQ